jgi:ABC-2 type transport system ATP-binding protein
MRAEYGTTVLLTTHLLEEADKCDRLAILDRGRLIASGTPAELKSRIGGDIVSLGSADLDGVAASVEQHLGIKPQVLQGQVRFEHAQGPEIVAQLMRQLPATVDSVSVSRPTLEDVFIRLTGHSFGDSQPPA